MRDASVPARVAVTGLGFISSIGNSKAEVSESLRTCRTGITIHEELERAQFPVRLAGTVKGFRFPSLSPEDWEYPEPYHPTREQLRSMSPSTLFGFCAMEQAIVESGLRETEISHQRTGLICASGGSAWLTYEHLRLMLERGPLRCPPMGLVASIAGSLNINLASCYRIQGVCFGVSSSCASSAHALGLAFDRISSHQQDRVFVVGAEDCNLYSIVPFVGVRALSTRTDPGQTPCAFDRNRDGFVVAGGAAALVLENLECAQRRGAAIIAEVIGWGEAADGYNVMVPEPNGAGLQHAMRAAVQRGGIVPDDIDYLNAHATSTIAGDAAEVRALRSVFANTRFPYVSSTKSLTGHGLSQSGALEAAISSLAVHEGFTPVSANILELDPEFTDIPVVTQSIAHKPRVVMSNSSGFGGANVSIILAHSHFRSPP